MPVAASAFEDAPRQPKASERHTGWLALMVGTP